MRIPPGSEAVSALLKRGHRVKSRELEVNIIGWQSDSSRVNKFDDFIGVYYRENKEWVSKAYAATTRPGRDWLLRKFTRNGTAILVTGQYRDSYQLGLHKGREALVQVAPVRVYRDSNGDSTWNKGKIEQGLFGINIHRAGRFSKLVGLWSAGCQVFQKASEFEEFLSIVKRSADMYGNSFDYTLVEI